MHVVCQTVPRAAGKTCGKSQGALKKRFKDLMFSQAGLCVKVHCLAQLSNRHRMTGSVRYLLTSTVFCDRLAIGWQRRWNAGWAATHGLLT